MRIVIVGAGQVGTSTAAELASDHEVVVIDRDPDRTEQLEYDLDVLTVCGDGASVSTLESAEIERADIVIASTDDDRVNLIVCELASVGADPFTIARTKNPKYRRAWEEGEDVFGVDLMVCSTEMTAHDIVRVVDVPAAIDIDPFADGAIEMVELEVGPESAVAGHRVAEADQFEQVTFVALFRDDGFVFPSGETRIKSGDRLVVIGPPDEVRSFATETAPPTTPAVPEEIVIVGGSQIGHHVARLLEAQGRRPTLVEGDPERARQLAETLPETLVVEREVTEGDFAPEAPIETADVVVAALPSDEQNLLVSMLARRRGADRIVSVVDDHAYRTLFEEVGIDVAVNPRTVTAEEIIRVTHREAVENLAMLENDQAEVMEINLAPTSTYVDRSVQEIATAFDGPLVFGAIVRAGEVLAPRGDTVLQAGDTVIAFITAELADRFATQAGA